jgi:hypothetical protein
MLQEDVHLNLRNDTLCSWWSAASFILTIMSSWVNSQWAIKVNKKNKVLQKLTWPQVCVRICVCVCVGGFPTAFGLPTFPHHKTFYMSYFGASQFSKYQNQSLSPASISSKRNLFTIIRYHKMVSEIHGIPIHTSTRAPSHTHTIVSMINTTPRNHPTWCTTVTTKSGYIGQED